MNEYLPNFDMAARMTFPWEDPSRIEKPAIFMSPYTEDPYHPDPYGGRPR